MSTFSQAFHTLGNGLHGAFHAVGSNVEVYVAAFLIVVLGVIAGYLAKWIVVLILRSIKLHTAAKSTGWNLVFGGGYDAVDLVGDFVRAFFVLVAFTEAMVALGVPSVDSTVHSLLNYLPNVVVAAIVLGVGGVLAGLTGRLVEVVAHALGSAQAVSISMVTKLALWVVWVVIALQQLQVSQSDIHDMFIVVVLSAGLAFGLGGREMAAGVLAKVGKKK